MAVDDDHLAFVQQQLAQFPDYQVKKMFGGVGFFKDAAMFGLIKHGVFMLRTDEQDLGPFAGQPQFTIEKPGKPMTMPYHVVPDAVMHNPALLAAYAHGAWERALQAKSNKKK